MTAPIHPDHALVTAARRREPAAVDWLSARLRNIPRLLRQVPSRGVRLPASDLDDVAQQATQVALDRLAGYHGLAPFDAWVYRVCEWTLLGFLRRRRRSAAATIGEDPVAAEADPAEVAFVEERRVRIRDAIDAIGGVEAEVVRARHLEGLSFASIAARSGIGMATLRTRYYRGLTKLRLRLSAFSNSDPPDDRTP